MICDCTVTQGREGEKGSWCIKCGTKVLEVHDRPCSECMHFTPEGEGRTGLCRRNLMRVGRDMHVTYFMTEGPGHFGLCFEACAALVDA